MPSHFGSAFNTHNPAQGQTHAQGQTTTYQRPMEEKRPVERANSSDEL
jgi:hypothetical protein